MKDIILINNKAKTTGIGTYGYALYENLKKTGRRSFDFKTLDSGFADESGSALYDFPRSIGKLLAHLEFLSEVPRSYRVYHLLNPNLGMLLPRIRPSVVTVHDVAVLKSAVMADVVAASRGFQIPMILAMQINMRFIKYADRILCLSNYTKHDLVSVLGIESGRVTVSYPGIDKEKFKPRSKMDARRSLGLPLNRRVVLHVGTDEPRKNFKTLLEAFRRVKRKFPDAVLVKVGGMRSETRQLVLAMGLEDSVIQYRVVPNTAPFYNAADLFVFPSYYEGFGYPAAEAMASGCPVVAADSSSLTEVVGKGGILVPPFDVGSLCEAMHQVLADSNRNATLVDEGFEQVKKFDWKKCAETTLETYENL